MKLYLHIGMGKTGTTSIQNTLKHNFDKLKNQNFLYTGAYLENLPIFYEWQNRWKFNKFFNLSKKEMKDSLLRLFTEIKQKHGNINLIWSNELFFRKKNKWTDVFLELKNEKLLEVIPIIYVREHISWINSAYIQWGIKHKTYKGKIKSFKEFIKHKDSLYFYPYLKDYMEKFPNTIIRNMSAKEDVVEDFLKVLGVDYKNFKVLHNNKKPSNEELLLNALFNNNFENEVLYAEFVKQVKNGINFNKNSNEYLQELFPKTKDIEDLEHTLKEDKKKVNEVLKLQNEPLLENFDINKLKEPVIDNEKLLFALSQIVMKQQKKIIELEEEIKKIKGE